MKYTREGVLAVAAEVDGDAAYDAENYYEGKFSIDSVLSQKVTVPDGCLLMELMDYDPAVAGAELQRSMERVAAQEDARGEEQRRLFLPPHLLSAES